MRDYVPDPLGSTVALLDNSQAQTDTFSYWPYGENRTRTGATPTPLQYLGTTGYYRDSTSKAYVRARTLDAVKTRWITQDPIGFDDGDTNLYRNVLNSPLNFVDPSGQLPSCALACIISPIWCYFCKRGQKPPFKEIGQCLKDCAGKEGRQWATCMLLCAGSAAINKNCSTLVCRAFPQFCMGAPDPCDWVKKHPINPREAVCQDCCEINHYCCLLTTKPNNWLKCDLNIDKCHAACSSGTSEISCDGRSRSVPV